MALICELKQRAVNLRALSCLSETSLSPLEARLLASRGEGGETDSLPGLLARPMLDLERGALRVQAAILAGEQIVVVADYDCDGATACAVAVTGLRVLGGKIGYVVPDRLIHGYGISPSVVNLAVARYPQARVLMTVDNGILGHAGITYAASLGLDVIVTDHHLPGADILDATAVIDPAQADCPSELPHLAGVGVALWLVAAVKRVRQAAGLDTPALNFLLPYAAIGTVADMVKLDGTNRRLINAGMDMMRTGRAPVGVTALIRESDCNPAYLTTQDIGFGLGPRINAAGRLESMETGIELLLTQDTSRARKLAKLLTATNEERKRLQKEATADASLVLDIDFDVRTRCIVKGSADWHPGVVGLVASRLKEKYHRPTFVFSLQGGEAKGSGRSIPGFHLKDALEEVSRRVPGVLAKFGGHAMAAGCTLTNVDALAPFEQAFAAVANERISAEMLDSVLWSDGPVPDLSLEEAARVLRHPWGQGFEAPAFDDVAKVVDVKPLGSAGLHWKVQIRLPGRTASTTVVLFNQEAPNVGQQAHFVLSPGLNTWQDETRLQWLGRVVG